LLLQSHFGVLFDAKGCLIGWYVSPVFRVPWLTVTQICGNIWTRAILIKRATAWHSPRPDKGLAWKSDTKIEC
jgi:hypothetical protein